MSWPRKLDSFALGLFTATFLAGQAPTPSKPADATQPGPTFKSSTRLVLTDLVVTDRNGQPIHGLKPQELTVLEDGKPQAITAFEEQRSDAAPKAAPVTLDLPKNVYTNYVVRTDPGALTVLLFDSLNTERQHLVYAKKEMLRFLKDLPPARRVALYTLGSQLRMVQSFTDDSDALITAAQQLSTKTHPLYTPSKELSATIGELKESDLAKNPRAFRAMVEFLGEDYEGKQESRAQETVDALIQLARALAVVPGRKNLIWISAGFPFDITSNAPQMQKTAALLAATRIAVYPVDVRGVTSMTADGATRDSEIFAPVPTETYETLSGQFEENISIVETMQNAAKLTGGRAYINKNDLKNAISDGMEAGSNYYTLAYRPVNTDWNGKFRKIAIKTSHPDARLLYRSGYYAILDPLTSKQDPSRVVALAMQPGVPVSTQLIMKARVVPPEQPDQGTTIDMLIDVHALAVIDGEHKQKTPEVQFVAFAWDSSGQQVASFPEEFKRPLSPDQWESLLRTGLQLRRNMALKPGSYQLRLGVMDRLSGRIGTLDIPLTIEVKAAAK